jgi:hypothetical protein
MRLGAKAKLVCASNPTNGGRGVAGSNTCNATPAYAAELPAFVK